MKHPAINVDPQGRIRDLFCRTYVLRYSKSTARRWDRENIRRLADFGIGDREACRYFVTSRLSCPVAGASRWLGAAMGRRIVCR